MPKVMKALYSLRYMIALGIVLICNAVTYASEIPVPSVPDPSHWWGPIEPYIYAWLVFIGIL